MNDQRITVKNGPDKSEFKGKVALQLVTAALAVFAATGRDVQLSQEEMLAVAGGIELAWMTFRQIVEIFRVRAEGAVRVAELELEAVKVASQAQYPSGLPTVSLTNKN